MPDRRDPNLIERFWPLGAAILGIGIAWGALTAALENKVDVRVYLTDKARADSTLGAILSSQQRVERYICRKDPGSC